MWECLKGRSRRKEINQIPGSVKVKERARDEEFETWEAPPIGTAQCDPFRSWKTKIKPGFGDPWEQFQG